MAKAKMDMSTLKRVLKYVRKYWIALTASLLMALIYVAMSLYIPILAGNGIDHIIDKGLVDFAALGKILLSIGICAGIAALSQWIMNELNNRITYTVTRDIRNAAFSHIQDLPLKYLDGHPHGDVVSRIVSDVDTFAEGLLMGFSQLFTGVLTIAGTLVVMLTIRWQIALVVIFITPLSLVVANFIAKRTYSMFQAQSKTKGEQTALINEMVGNLKVVKAFSHEKEVLEQFDQINEELEKRSLRAIFFSSMTNPATRFVNSVVYAGVGLVGALMAIGTGFTVGNLSSFLNYANQYTKPFNEISGVITELQNALACAGRVFELMDAPAQTPDPKNPIDVGVVKGDVLIEDLCFSYDPAKPLIRDLNLQIPQGKRIAIVGPTGCGKTTFLNLLMRFYDPVSGKICLDGVNTQEISRNDLRKNVGMVLQDTWLMQGTIRDNISMGNQDATDEQIIQAAKLSHAHNFIKRLPNGYDTVIGETGHNLSQGQMQLLCIARVMLALPPMLFLDEATSSIDTRTELRVQKAFETLMKGRTSFIVAHRLSTVQEADLILVMKDGNVIESGTHNGLIAQKGFYATLYESQFAH